MKKLQTKRNTKRRRIWLLGLLLVIIALFGFHIVVTKKVEQLRNSTIEFTNQKTETETRDYIESIKQQVNANHQSIPIDKSSIVPFKEIDALDEDAKDWSNVFDGYAACGILVFDANGDGLMDMYLTHNGENWTRPTDADGILMDKPYRQHNGLYLHQGNDEEGNPVYKQVKELSQNEIFTEEELLIENFLYPRKSSHERVDDKVARISMTAIAVDINADGRLDVLVANGLPGMIWSHEKTQRVLGQFVRPIGREAVNSKLPLSARGLYFLKNYSPNDHINDMRLSARGEEAYGANSVFLNMGDKDEDGVPEWKDISVESGLQGKRNTLNLLAEDFDRDGDIDIFETNVQDFDFASAGAKSLVGAANQLYLNRLKETGTLTFEEVSESFGCDGLYDENHPVPHYYRLRDYKFLPQDYSIALFDFEPYRPDFLEINGEKCEPGQISWTSVATDVNEDGYPDIWVANDFGFLRLYINQQGKGFKLENNIIRKDKTGHWMSFSPADFNGDLKEDLFMGSVGGTSMNVAISIPDPASLFQPTMLTSVLAQQYFADNHRSMHAFVDGADFSHEMKNRIRHSDVLPPDASIPNNIRRFGMNQFVTKYDINSIDPYEFVWGSTILDVQNDGKDDLYWIGCIFERGGNIFPIVGTGPGRLLVNTTKEKSNELTFSDLTAEYHLFNINELQYDRLEEEGYFYRKAPRQNWPKKSMLYSYDVSVWGFQGPDLAEQITNQDMIQAAENGRALIAADLNNDGFQDVIVRNLGGYDSRSSNAKNLKTRVNGEVVVIPSHDSNYPGPTDYEPGDTRMFINRHSENHWVKIQLRDDTEGTFNPDAIGAKVYINEKYIKVNRAGGGGFISNYTGSLHFGLGKGAVNTVRVVWPDARQTTSVYPIDDFHSGVLVISKTKGVEKVDNR